MIAIGSNQISAIYKGDVKFAKAYLGADLLWSAITSVDWIELRANGADPTPRVFNSSDIDEVAVWAGASTPYVPRWVDVSSNGNDASQITAISQPSYSSTLKRVDFYNSELVCNDLVSGYTANPRIKIKFYINDTQAWIISRRGGASGDLSALSEWQLYTYNSPISFKIVDNGTYNTSYSVTAPLVNDAIWEIDTYYDRANSQLVMNYSVNGGAWQQAVTAVPNDITIPNNSFTLLGRAWSSLFALNGAIYYVEYSDYVTEEVLLSLKLQ